MKVTLALVLTAIAFGSVGAQACDPVWERKVPIYKRVKGRTVVVGHRCVLIPPNGGPSTGGGHNGGGLHF